MTMGNTARILFAVLCRVVLWVLVKLHGFVTKLFKLVLIAGVFMGYLCYRESGIGEEIFNIAVCMMTVGAMLFGYPYLVRWFAERAHRFPGE